MEFFYSKCARSENDSVNKQREDFLCTLLTESSCDPKTLFLQEELRTSLHKISLLSGVGDYSNVSLSKKAGRRCNYDFDATYTTPDGIQLRKIEFKYGCSSIQKLPQFLSLSVKQFLPEFIPYWWETYLDRYLLCDEGLTYTKPSLEEYTKIVGSVSSTSPFIEQLRQRESIHKAEKHKIVDECISSFLQNLSPFSIEFIIERCRAQEDKYFLMWDKRMVVDTFKPEYCSNLRMDSVNKNCIRLVSDGARFSLLLRWRNHKGILNPAWQISMKAL